MKLYKDVYQLLSENDCVIIPDFGGFVANYCEAKVDLRTQEFCPPARKLAFNESLKNNDGLLINHICQTQNVNWNTANSFVADFVSEINNSLKDNQTVTFEKMGQFTRKSGILVFVPFAENNLMESSFGLPVFHFPMLKPANSFVEIQKQKPLSKTKSAKSNKPVKSRRTLVFTLSTAAVITGLVIISVQFGWFAKSNENNGYANINPVETLINSDSSVKNSNVSKEKDIKTESVEKIEKSDDKVEAVTVVENKTAVKSDNKIVVAETNTEYKSHIIAGSFSNIENANNLQKKLVESGLPSQVLPVSNGMYRVAVKSYTDSSKATADLSSLKSQTGNNSLWVLNL